MMKKKVIVFGILSVATLLVSIINIHPRGGSDDSVRRYPTTIRFSDTKSSRSDLILHHSETQDIVFPYGHPESPDDWVQRQPSSGGKGFLLALYILEQLTMSSSHYISLLNLAHSWKLSGVEPTICHSRMYGLPGISGVCHQHHNASKGQRNSIELPYSRLFDLSYLNSELERCLYSAQHGCEMSNQNPVPCSVIESLDHFVQSSHREIVLVHFVRGIGGGASRMTFLPRDLMHRFEQEVTFPVGEPIVDCTRLARQFGVNDVVEHVLNKVATRMSVFMVQRVICINTDRAKDGVDVAHLRNAIFQSLPNVSVVFTKWQNRGVIGPGSNILSRCKVSPIHHSQDIVLASKRFLSSMDISEPFLSVHLRLERLYQCEAVIPGYTKCCVGRLSSLLSNVLQRHGMNKKDVLIVKDYGPYGTDSCTYKQKYVNISICLNLTKEFLANLQHYGYSASEFLPIAYDHVPDNSGFASLVEAEAILSGSALIAVGFGSYQGTVIKQFLGIDDPNVGFKHFDNKHHYGPSALYDRVYRACTCTPLKGHLEKLNGINLGHQSCEDLNSD